MSGSDGHASLLWKCVNWRTKSFYWILPRISKIEMRGWSQSQAPPKKILFLSLSFSRAWVYTINFYDRNLLSTVVRYYVCHSQSIRPSPIFARNASSYTLSAVGYAPTLPANIRLGRTWNIVTNTLAYHGTGLMPYRTQVSTIQNKLFLQCYSKIS